MRLAPPGHHATIRADHARLEREIAAEPRPPGDRLVDLRALRARR